MKSVEEIRKEFSAIIHKGLYGKVIPLTYDELFTEFLSIKVGGKVEEEHKAHPMNIHTNVCNRCGMGNVRAKYRKCKISRPKTLRDLLT